MTNKKQNIKVVGTLKELNQLRKEVQFKEDRISDLLVERDKGIWRNKALIDFAEKIKEEILKYEFMNRVPDFNEKSNEELDCEIRRDLFNDIDKILMESKQ